MATTTSVEVTNDSDHMTIVMMLPVLIQRTPRSLGLVLMFQPRVREVIIVLQAQTGTAAFIPHFIRK